VLRAVARRTSERVLGRAEHPNSLDRRSEDGVAELTDAELVKRCSRGEEKALELLHTRHAPALLRFLERLMRDASRAEDVCSEAFMRIWRRAELFDPARGTFTAWLYRAAANLAYNRLSLKSASEGQLSALPVLPPAQVEAPIEGASSDERQRLVHEALSGLSDRDRAILTLRHIEEKPVAEIAEILGIPEGTVKSRCHYAMHRLRDVLEPEFRDDG
jgi:RNA polymerase sigma-70 factor (ECF subfamily)